MRTVCALRTPYVGGNGVVSTNGSVPATQRGAVELLDDLKALSERDGNAVAFDKRVRGLREKHARKPSLLNRLDRARL
jgi:hypothetical protein